MSGPGGHWCGPVGCPVDGEVHGCVCGNDCLSRRYPDGGTIFSERRALIAAAWAEHGSTVSPNPAATPPPLFGAGYTLGLAQGRENIEAVLRELLPEHSPAFRAGLASEVREALAGPKREDEERLAELLLDHALDQDQTSRPAGAEGSGFLCECGLEIIEPRTGPGIGWLHRKHVAAVVVGWLAEPQADVARASEAKP